MRQVKDMTLGYEVIMTENKHDSDILSIFIVDVGVQMDNQVMTFQWFRHQSDDHWGGCQMNVCMDAKRRVEHLAESVKLARRVLGKAWSSRYLYEMMPEDLLVRLKRIRISRFVYDPREYNYIHEDFLAHDSWQAYEGPDGVTVAASGEPTARSGMLMKCTSILDGRIPGYLSMGGFERWVSDGRQVTVKRGSFMPIYQSLEEMGI